MGLIRDYKQASIVYTIWHILLRAHFQLRHDMYTITSTFPTHFVVHGKCHPIALIKAKG
jgi:hypothetical protein